MDVEKDVCFTRNVFDTHYELEVSLAEVEKYYNKQLWGTYMGHDFQVTRAGNMINEAKG